MSITSRGEKEREEKKKEERGKLLVSTMPQYRNTDLLDYCLQHLSTKILVRFVSYSIHTVLKVHLRINQTQRLTEEGTTKVPNPSTLQCSKPTSQRRHQPKHKQLLKHFGRQIDFHEVMKTIAN